MEPRITPEQAVKLCDRNFGIGGDGMIFVMPGTDSANYTMRTFNSDGSEPEMCSNGVRCFARFIAELENLQGNHRLRLTWVSLFYRAWKFPLKFRRLKTI